MRIATTTLEQYRLFCDAEWMAEADLIATIKGEVHPSPQMRLGTAFHAVLEDPARYRVLGGYACDGFSLPDDTMQPALDLIDRRGLFEVKATARFGSHTVVAKADQLVGASILEHKTTCSTFDVDKYLTAYQWRFELAIFDALNVTYRVFCLDEPQEGCVRLKSIECCTVYPYAELHADCADLVQRFADYVTAKKLTGYLERQGSGGELAA